MSNAVDVKGLRFGRLVAIKPTNKRASNGSIIWECLCDCGTVTNVAYNSLKNGQVSCGCKQKESVKIANTTHGKSYGKLYKIWTSLKSRCYNPNDKAYKDYGGRGIKVYNDWYYGFITFYEWAFENGYNDNLTIDRINNNGNYEPTNCRWVDRKIQQNNRRNNHYITIKGETKTLQEWGEYVGIKPNTILCRIRKNWSNEEAIFTPLQKKGANNESL